MIVLGEMARHTKAFGMTMPYIHNSLLYNGPESCTSGSVGLRC